MTKSTDSTAWRWRDTAILTEFLNNDQATAVKAVMAEFYGDKNKLQGYYNYANPLGNPNWRQYYFGDHYSRLSQIKLKYDPLNYFGNPLQVEPAIPGGSSSSSAVSDDQLQVEPAIPSSKGVSLDDPLQVDPVIPSSNCVSDGDDADSGDSSGSRHTCFSAIQTIVIGAAATVLSLLFN